ncbi:gliding motility-associated peptidyl-prolyl isomerase GldI [Marixanthomonas spongiae]|uniref:Peptidyl-prolyl cis-trans isomerase n=1 Tax=Marixanthomonas spongiae TaxID=2174845 RepID=A0A2U0HXC2_9FLAO|nr:gliding motility-associated peptidyl-prolyl isomerase GldI [Marixanthomonas spongiae]PVW13522.1 gliding motility-associated peptidyl-prolyl isomerase GldI [Marixanthomonas spongiae]
MLHKLASLCIILFLAFSCKGPEARRPVQQSSGTFIKESAQRNKALYAEEQQRIKSIIEADTTTDYLTSESGFWYYYNTKDSTAAPKPELGDEVTFTYNIKALDGKTILSATETGLQHYKVDQTNQDLISGLRDGIKLMQEGETVTFIFPSYKAYGYYGIENKLGTNIPVKSTVTLKTIKQNQEN